ncbi:MAG: cysteine--tRNA ligase [Dehalococcoidia bacterium]|nr:cysteine--tRNA ligase [Dehalococcoidia bacterium]
MSGGELFLYNTLSQRRERVVGRKLGLYVCGVTPYDTSHLGHAFTYTAFDVLVRCLRFLGREVTYVQNVTDIDDDILLRARSTGVDWKELGDREYARFRESMAALGNLPPDVAPRATEHIPEMLLIIQGLLAKGLAYEREGCVYFQVQRATGFGKLFREPYAAQLEIANERGNFPADARKKDPLDFVLWQAKKPGEPSWPAPWGEGRPGWHIECSAMSMKYLGQTFALHGGGEDLVFPHHDAEIAQSEGFTGKPFVRCWAHTAMVYSGAHKMSKSLGNMVFVSDLLRVCSPDAVRLYLLAHHYRQSWNHDRRALVPARRLAASLARALAGAVGATTDDLDRHAGPFLEAMADDLDTPRAIGELQRLAETADVPARRAARALGERVLGLGFAGQV